MRICVYIYIYTDIHIATCQKDGKVKNLTFFGDKLLFYRIFGVTIFKCQRLDEGLLALLCMLLGC